jgi:heptose I phosphotransferase
MGETLWQRWSRGGRRLWQQPPWEELAGPDWPDRVMSLPVTDRFHAKQGRSIGRWVLGGAGQRLVVYLKRHYRLPWRHGLLALLRPSGAWSPALQEWQHLAWARAQGLPVPRAVACGQYIGPGVRLQSFLAVEELTGMLPLHEAIPQAARLLEPVAFRRWKRGLAAEMARLARALHHRRRFHKDLYLCHFYIAEADTATAPAVWRGRVRLIDLHRLGHHPLTWPWWLAKDLAQLLYSSAVPGVDDRDRLWFWKRYRERIPEGRAARLLRRWVRLKGWRYARHSARKRQAGNPLG